jgi:hypothetical protein
MLVRNHTWVYVSLPSLNSEMTNVVKKGQQGIDLRIDTIILCIPYHLHGLSAVMSSWLRQLLASSCESTGFSFFPWKSFQWLTGFFLSPLTTKNKGFQWLMSAFQDCLNHWNLRLFLFLEKTKSKFLSKFIYRK